MNICGIDPGVCGAIAFVNGGRVVCHDMPTVEIRGKRRVCAPMLAALLREHAIDHAVLEEVQGVQGTGATSAFSFGRSFGLVEGVLAALAIPTTLVRPQAWTKALGVSRDKGQHRQAAMRAWPADAGLFARVKDDGRADACLLVQWYLARGVHGLGMQASIGAIGNA